MMKSTFLLLLGALVLPHSLPAASSAALEKEYQQVRTIALRDPRVQSAYRDADRRLDDKILRIDPALESYVKAKQAARDGLPAPKSAQPVTKPFTKPAPVKPTASKTTHAVAAGETLGGIAAKHHVTVAALKSANHIQDERKLRVGQVLAIPAPASGGGR
jgi:LysM repeat protein